jgi:hypothetical protein
VNHRWKLANLLWYAWLLADDDRYPAALVFAEGAGTLDEERGETGVPSIFG